MSGSGWTGTSMPYLTPRPDGDSDAWTAEAEAAGRRGAQRILHAGAADTPAEVARMLDLTSGESVIVRRRIIELDGEPTELTDTYYPADIAAGTLWPARQRSGAAR